MPELPDVELQRRYLAATALRREISTVESMDSGMLDGVSESTLRRRLLGSTLVDTHRHGKWCLAQLDGDRGWLGLHFGMTGVLAAWRTNAPVSPPHLALRLVFNDGTHLDDRTSRRLGHIALADHVEGFIEARDLGPDASQLDGALLGELCNASRSGIKALLTDQSQLAGLGNIYADEILFMARLHPEAPARGLDDDQRTALLSSTTRVLRTAIEGGADPDRMPSSWLLPLRREGAPCPRCGGCIQRIRVGGRATYLCPYCQRL